ncbi:hypothetical protein [uncultured Polaribacter sp.]|uniref:hypothetical protein n=1 Tax=uncultured Polaribacter sp. TaxID=174711 RepID=UPI002638CC9C|nr:hypothetical protein [uncultured Polaribacter sp.]
MKNSFFKTKTLIMLLFLTIGCSETEKEVFTPTLPPITQTGENTFGCYIDGKLLVPRDRSVFGGTTVKGMTISEYSSSPTEIDFFNLRIIDGQSDVGDFSFYLYNLDELGEGTYNIKKGNLWQSTSDIKTINFWLKTPRNISVKRYFSIENGGTLTIIKYDYTNGIISGTFSCKAINNNDSSDVIEITEGRFDINLNTLNDTEFP